MAFIGNLLNPAQGAGFQAQSAPVTSPVTPQQTQAAIAQSQSGIGGQQALVNALGAQNGIQNQSNVFNQLQGVANGTGPNPAQALLAQQTGNNIASQASLMAGQRGAGANAGLLARQAAQNGGALQQNAVGQAATLQANQSLGALNQLGGIAGQQVGQQTNAQQALISAQQGQQNSLLNAGLQSQEQGVQNAAQQNSANASIAKGNQAAQAGLVGGVLNSIGSAVKGVAGGGAAMASGGEVAFNLTGDSNNKSDDKKDASMFDLTSDPGKTIGAGTTSLMSSLMPQKAAPTGLHAQILKGVGQGAGSDATVTAGGAGDLMDAGSAAPLAMFAAHGGQVPALVSPGEKIVPADRAKAVKDGKASAMDNSKTVPGKPVVGGAKNSYANDTVPMKLKEGSIVLPRSVTKSSNPKEAADKFVAALKSKKRK